MKTYSEQSRNLAANVVLEAAVAEAVALFKASRVRWFTTTLPRSMTVTYLGDVDYRGSRSERARIDAERVLLAAAQAAELLECAGS